MSLALKRCRRGVRCVGAAWAVAAAAWASTAQGVVVVNDEPMDAPLDGYVGSWNGSSAVCVGTHWIISAKHVGGAVGGTFVMQGAEYRAVEIVEHPSLDLQLIRVAEDLPGHHRLASVIVPGEVALLGGCGVTGSSTYDGGYAWSGPREETWGANVIEGAGSLISIRFDDPDGENAVPHEATFAVNDSGAGLFVFGADGALELAGVAVSVTGFGTSAYGSRAFSVNMAPIRHWVLAVVDPGAPVTSSVEAPRAGLFSGGAPSVVWATAVIGGVLAGRRRRGSLAERL